MNKKMMKLAPAVLSLAVAVAFALSVGGLGVRAVGETYGYNYPANRVQYDPFIVNGSVTYNQANQGLIPTPNGYVDPKFQRSLTNTNTTPRGTLTYVGSRTPSNNQYGVLRPTTPGTTYQPNRPNTGYTQTPSVNRYQPNTNTNTNQRGFYNQNSNLGTGYYLRAENGTLVSMNAASLQNLVGNLLVGNSNPSANYVAKGRDGRWYLMTREEFVQVFGSDALNGRGTNGTQTGSQWNQSGNKSLRDLLEEYQKGNPNNKNANAPSKIEGLPAASAYSFYTIYDRNGNPYYSPYGIPDNVINSYGRSNGNTDRQIEMMIKYLESLKSSNNSTSASQTHSSWWFR